jgi:hypothetical protein
MRSFKILDKLEMREMPMDGCDLLRFADARAGADNRCMRFHTRDEEMDSAHPHGHARNAAIHLVFGMVFKA